MNATNFDVNSHCLACGASVSEKIEDCYQVLDDILDRCSKCGKPLYKSVGDCLRCRGHVYVFGDRIACSNTLTGNCNFVIDTSALPPYDSKNYLLKIVRDLLRNGLNNLVFQDLVSQIDYCREEGVARFA